MVAVAVRDERELVLYPTQFDFVADPSRWVAFVAGRNAGKTFAGSWKAVARAQRGGLGIIAAPDFPMLEFGAKRAFLDRLREMRVPFDPVQQRAIVSIPMWGAEVRFATLETESRVRGPNYHWAWVDEADRGVDREIWQALKGAVREGDSPQLFATSTPKGRRLIYEEWIANATPHHALYKASTHDNPHIDAADYVAGLGYVGRFYRQEIEATFEGAEGLVYPGFDREKHLRTVDTEGWRRALGIDIGTRNPTAILDARAAGDGRIHVAAEVYRRNMGSSDILAAIRAVAAPHEVDAIYIDPSAAGYIVDLEQEGYPAVKADNAVVEGIGRVTTALAEGLTIDPSCANLVAEMESYAYPDGGKAEKDAPVKQNDHAADALRYLVMGESEPPLHGRVW